MIGRAVVEQLLAAGEEVVVLDLAPVADGDDDGVRHLAGDVTDAASIATVLREQGIDRIVHMAAVVAAAQGDPARAFAVNVGGTVAVLEAAREVGVERVVYCSSRAVYGDVLGAGPRGSAPRIDETQPINPVNVYDVTKAAAEGLARNYRRNYGLEVVSLRFASIFGPGKDAASHGGFSLLSQIVTEPNRGRPLRVERGGDQVDDIIYVEEVARGTALAVAAEAVPEDAYHISSGAGHTLRDLARAVESVIPGAELEIGPGLDFIGVGVDYYAVLDNRRAERDLGFTPRLDLEQSVARFVERLDAAEGAHALP